MKRNHISTEIDGIMMNKITQITTKLYLSQPKSF